ncbi:MAG: hypothetical protein DHS20C15_04850 [Planctomycetota bacterium]|nr:MAG: hypothetical protein DHS20C15_04850 [Planctomycetota bacterium]
MSFQTFKKYERPLLMFAVVFTVAVFVFFPSFGDMDSIFGGDTAEADLAGEFVVATTGESTRISLDEFYRARQNLVRITGNRNVEDDDVWAQLILRADAVGAGIQVTDADLRNTVKNILTRGNPSIQVGRAEYEAFCRSLGYSSLRDFEVALTELLLAGSWSELMQLDAGTVNAEQVYEQWKVENELFDFRAAVIPSIPAEEVADPGDAELQEYFDDMSESLRTALFSTPAEKDIVYAWRDLDAPLDGIDDTLLATLSEVTDAEIDARFRQVKDTRWPDADDDADDDAEPEDDEHAGHDHPPLDDDVVANDEQRELLRTELMNIAVLNTAATELRNTADADAGISKDRFLEVAQAWGMQVNDPEGLLDPTGLEALEAVGDSRLQSRLRTLKAGDLHQLRPFLPEETMSFMALVEASKEPEPRSFENAREDILEQWRSTQRDRNATAFMDALVDAARAHPDAQEALATVMESVQERVAARLEANATAIAEAAAAALEEGAGPVTEIEALDASEVEAQELAAAEGQINAVLLPLRHLVFDEVTAAQGVEVLEFSGVSRSYHLDPDEEEDEASIAAYLKAGVGEVFRLSTDEISTRAQYHPQSDSWLAVHVQATSFPDKAAMLADKDGMETARRQAQNTEYQLFSLELTPAALMQSHQLRLPEVPDESSEELPASGG